MNIKDFEKSFDKKILERGKEYYNSGCVYSLEKTSDKSYTAEVDGSDVYEVDVDLDKNGEIEYISCDCPYEYGFYCKHEAAVLYALRDRYNTITVQKNPLNELVANCEKNLLVDVILEYASKDKAFRDYLMLRLSDTTDTDKIIAEFEKMARKFFDGHSSVQQMITATETIFEKISHIDDSAEKIKVYCNVISKLKSTDIYNCSDYYYEEDEDSWELFEVVNDYSNNITLTAENLIKEGDTKKISRAWSYLVNVWDGTNEIDGSDYLFSAMLEFAKLPEYRQKLDNLLSVMEHSVSGYEKGATISQRFDILEKYGTEEECISFIYKYIYMSSYRMKAIDIAIEKKDFAEAEKLAVAGMENDGYKVQWLEKLHKIYSMTNNEKLVDVCRQLVMERRTEYYSEWKNLIPDEKKVLEIERLLNDKDNGSYHFMIVEENMTNRIYDECVKGRFRISEHYKYMKNTAYEEKGRLLFEERIRDSAKNASDRKQYHEVCRVLKIYAQECGRNNAVLIADDFRKNYNRKPAFMDELSKAGF